LFVERGKCCAALTVREVARKKRQTTLHWHWPWQTFTLVQQLASWSNASGDDCLNVRVLVNALCSNSRMARTDEGSLIDAKRL
jgi:hypothetical protein